ncbi:MAG TPA: DUF885 domain-containing protein [Acidimicrobiia bacterium]|nr:DUF885 domain-containing protein [Acidimicrobiia bacterium]
MSNVFEIADRLVDDLCAVSPVLSTMLGLPGSDDRWGNDLGLAGLDERRAIRARYEPQLTPHLEDPDPKDRLAARVILGSFSEAEEADRSGDHFRDLRHMASPFHRIRSIFDMMPTGTADARDNIVKRLETIAEPLADYRTLLGEGISSGMTVARRQVESVIAQTRRMSEDPTSLGVIVDKLDSEGLKNNALAEAVVSARAAISEFGDWLEQHYLPKAVERDAVGRDVYLRAADRLVGMAIDPEEAYAWGWMEFARLHAEMERVAEEIRPGAGFEAVKDHLETDPEVTAAGTDELVAFVEERLRQAVDDLAGSHFDVPDLIKPLTVSIAPPGTPLGAYYTRPSEDFARPGGVWYSIGSQDVFPLYQHVSTAYHEGFPGHHLQIATAMIRKQQISRFQRLMTWYPGYGEGWGMYAEVLMGELGYLSNPQHYFGMLAKQMYRTARVVVDIGLHLEKEIDGSSPIAPGHPWSFESAVELIRVYGFRTADQARDEVLRYLGWPGQAIAYKLGEREILEIRTETRNRLGGEFDLNAFHSTILDNGAMRLDLLREVVAEHLPG